MWKIKFHAIFGHLKGPSSAEKIFRGVTYRHPARFDRAWSRRGAMDAWFLRVPKENTRLISLWLRMRAEILTNLIATSSFVRMFVPI